MRWRFVALRLVMLLASLGVSITIRENVSALIASRIWTTAGLVLYASLIIVVLGIGLGVVSGLRPGTLDTSTLLVTAVCAAIPALGNGTGFLSNVRHFTLPAIALATASLAIVARVTRASVRQEGGREHVQTALAAARPDITQTARRLHAIPGRPLSAFETTSEAPGTA